MLSPYQLSYPKEHARPFTQKSDPVAGGVDPEHGPVVRDEVLALPRPADLDEWYVVSRSGQGRQVVRHVHTTQMGTGNVQIRRNGPGGVERHAVTAEEEELGRVVALELGVADPVAYPQLVEIETIPAR